MQSAAVLRAADFKLLSEQDAYYSALRQGALGPETFRSGHACLFTVSMKLEEGGGPPCVLPVQATYPLDLVRTRLAYDTSDGDAARRVTGSQAGTSGRVPDHTRLLVRNPRKTIRGVLATTLREEGVRGLYRGIGPTMCGILPYAGLKFYVYQSLKQQYRRCATCSCLPALFEDVTS